MLNNVQQKRIVTGQHMRPSPQGCRYRRLGSEPWWFTAVAVAGLVLAANSAFGWQVRGFSLRENALVRGANGHVETLVRGANGHVQRTPTPRILNGVRGARSARLGL